MVNAMRDVLSMDGHGADKEDEDEMDEKKETVELRLKSIDVSEHVNALVDGEGDLSEDFKKKSSQLYLTQ